MKAKHILLFFFFFFIITCLYFFILNLSKSIDRNIELKINNQKISIIQINNFQNFLYKKIPKFFIKEDILYLNIKNLEDENKTIIKKIFYLPKNYNVVIHAKTNLKIDLQYKTKHDVFKLYKKDELKIINNSSKSNLLKLYIRTDLNIKENFPLIDYLDFNLHYLTEEIENNKENKILILTDKKKNTLEKNIKEKFVIIFTNNKNVFIQFIYFLKIFIVLFFLIKILNLKILKNKIFYLNFIPWFLNLVIFTTFIFFTKDAITSYYHKIFISNLLYVSFGIILYYAFKNYFLTKKTKYTWEIIILYFAVISMFFEIEFFKISINLIFVMLVIFFIKKYKLLSRIR